MDNIWFMIVFDTMLVLLIVMGLIFLRAWWTIRRTEGKIVAEIWGPDGFPVRHLVKPDKTGDTVTLDDKVYRLKEDKPADKPANNPNSHAYPSRRYTKYPANPPFGIKPLQVILRIESWEYDNPEPIRPFYGRFDENGKFTDSQLTVTSTEWQAQKSVIQATGIAMSVQEREAREKEWARAMANLPNKMVVYIGLGAAAIGSVIAAVMVYQMAMG